MANLNINLLPENLSANSKQGKLKKLLNKILLIGTVVLVSLALVASVFLFILSVQLNNIEKEKDQIASQVKNYQETEQKLFFIQDRLNKIKQVKAADKASKSIAGFKQILTILPLNSKLIEAEVNASAINIVLNISNSSDLTSFLSQIVSGQFKRVNLKDFNFSPESGYTLTMAFIIE